MRQAMLMPLIALVLTACGGADVSLTNASPDEVAKQVDAAGGASFSPGKWEIVTETVSVDIPGIDPKLKNEMSETLLEKTQTATMCITKRQGQSPAAAIIARSQGRCTYQSFTIDDGAIEGSLRCPARGAGASMTMQVRGTFDAESFSIENETVSDQPDAPAVRITGRSGGKRVGDCTAAEERKADAEADR